MEGAQGELGTRLTNGLGGDNPNRRSHLNHLATTQVHAIALGTDAVVKLTGERGADDDLGYIGIGEAANQVMAQHIATFSQYFTRLEVNHILGNHTTKQAGAHRLPGDIIALADGNAILGIAVQLVDNHILSNIHQATGQVAGIRSTQSSIRQTLAGAMGGDEVFQSIQSFTEV
jgi:hypothetical protein